MKHNISLWQISGYIFTLLSGTLLHFLYGLSGKSAAAALFSGVNESTWEHMKLLFFPLFTFALFQYRFFKDYGNFFFIKLIGILVGLILIPVIFYTYNGVIGRSPDWVNIGIFFVSAAASFATEALLLKESYIGHKNQLVPIAVLCAIGVLFVVFTFRTPHLAIFRDPITGEYGIPK